MSADVTNPYWAGFDNLIDTIDELIAEIEENS